MMRSPLTDHLNDILQATADVTDGAAADYIPELASADPDSAAVALCTADGILYSAGDDEHLFSIQSMSKPFAYAAAIERHGLERVLDHVGVEPSGDAFNELSLDPDSGLPRNPMINAGALVTHSLLGGDADTRRTLVFDLLGTLTEHPVDLDARVADSERSTADRNTGLAYLMHGAGVLTCDPADVVRSYIDQCAASVCVRDLALMAATLANGGVHARSGERVFSREATRQVLSVMSTCGMYDAAGDWVTTVGIPAKSGVAGGIIGVLPGQVGIAVFSPRLDSHGNSARGIVMMERLSAELDLHLLESARPVKSALRERTTLTLPSGDATLYRLQGDLMLTSIESLTRQLVDDPPTTTTIVFDLSRVDEIYPVARRTAERMTTILLDEGYTVVTVDPDQTAPSFTDSTGRPVQQWDVHTLDEHLHANR